MSDHSSAVQDTAAELRVQTWNKPLAAARDREAHPEVPLTRSNAHASSSYESNSSNDRCFFATVIVEGAGKAIKVTYVLFDTGASETMISDKLVREAGLKRFKTTPQHFEIADGTIIMRDEKIECHIWIAGVRNRISAYVDDSDSSFLILMGCPALATFMCEIKVGRLVTVAKSDSRGRQSRMIVEEEWTAPSMSRMTLAAGSAWSLQHGKPLKEAEVKQSREKEAGTSAGRRKAFAEGWKWPQRRDPPLQVEAEEIQKGDSEYEKSYFERHWATSW